MVNITRRMRFACWVTEAANTHSEYVISYWFSPATLAKCRRLRFTPHAHCLTCLFSVRGFSMIESTWQVLVRQEMNNVLRRMQYGEKRCGLTL